jgi:histidinol-phosphate phosphatase family protein
MNNIRQAFILCGGLGTRLKPFTESNPKPMILCNGRPFLEYLIEQLIDIGIDEIILATGYLGDKIESYFGDGSSFGCKIIYSRGPKEWLTAYRVLKASEYFDKQFLLLYSDNFTVYNLVKASEIHKLNASAVTLMCVKKNPGNLNIENNGVVSIYKNKRENHLEHVEIGYMIIDRDIFMKYVPNSNVELSQVLEKISKMKLISAINTDDSYYSISDPVRWKLAEEYLSDKKVIFLDRDGVLNKKKAQGEYVCNWEEFVWIESAKESLKELARLGYQFIVITNQAGIARGICKESEVIKIHERIKSELKLIGVNILEFYYCPHGWSDDCICRKPKPGMLFAASRDYKIRLDKTYFIGDDIRDMEAASASNCIGVLYDESNNLHEQILKLIEK